MNSRQCHKVVYILNRGSIVESCHIFTIPSIEVLPTYRYQKREINYLYRSISKGDPASKVCTMNMAVKRSRVELSHHKYLIYTAIEAVAHRDINKPMTSSKRDLSNATRTKIRRPIYL